jgi:uncharacterized protein
MTEVVVWNAWLGGVAVGIYGLAQFVLTNKVLGVSTGYGSLCSLASRQKFFRVGAYSERINWRLFFLLGIPLGGLIAALTSPGSLKPSFSVGALYDGVLPQVLWAKGLILAAGGFMMGLGARMADGCTSGHAISGIALLNWPSMLASAGFFAGGIVIVQLLFRLF